jgi:hypothetical protein
MQKSTIRHILVTTNGEIIGIGSSKDHAKSKIKIKS